MSSNVLVDSSVANVKSILAYMASAVVVVVFDSPQDELGRIAGAPVGQGRLNDIRIVSAGAYGALSSYEI